MKPHMLRLSLASVALALISLTGYAQDHFSILSAYFNKVSQGDHAVLPTEVVTNADQQTILSALDPYLNDSVQSVRVAACEIIHMVGSYASDENIRRRAVDLLMRSYELKFPQLNDHILESLTQYAADDFTPLARDSIRSLVRQRPMYLNRILMLAGFLNLRDLRTEIVAYTKPGYTTQVRWAAYLSLARMGQVSATVEILNRVQGLPLNDDVVYQVFPDLIYTRQPSIIAYVVASLQNPESNCLSADAERQVPISCGYRIMEQLAPVVEGFPFVLEENGDLDVADYHQALETVRHWFKTNETYTLLTNHY